jgi:serine protease Do
MTTANHYRSEALNRWGSTLVVLFMILLIEPRIMAQRTPPPDTLERMNESVDALMKKVWPSVVQIHVTSYGSRAESNRGEANVVVGRQRSIGSGFVIDSEGYIITNAHVVSGAQRVQVVLPPPDANGTLASALSGRHSIVPARIVGISREIDLALLKIDGVKLPALPLATYRNLRQGEVVFAFGSPEGLRNTVTHGLISAIARQTDPDSPLIYVQTDASINPGNSGGPLVNIKGEVVGVNTFILSQSGGNEGLGFAIPSATVRTAYRQWKQFGQLRRQEIGIGIQTITPVLAAGLSLSRDYGVIISDVWPGGPAEAAGLMPGDILISIDGQPANDLPTVNYYFRLRDTQEKAQLVVLRGATQLTFSVAVVEERSDLDAMTAMADPEKNLVSALGILGVEVDTKIIAMAKGLRDPYGIIVVARVAGATGEAPLAVGDVIRMVNGKPVATLDRLRRAVQAISPGTPITLQIQREGKLMYLAFTLE